MGKFLLDLVLRFVLNMVLLAVCIVVGWFVLWAVTLGRWKLEDKDGKNSGDKRIEFAMRVGLFVLVAAGVGAYFAFR
jgi:hypothetical protein